MRLARMLLAALLAVVVVSIAPAQTQEDQVKAAIEAIRNAVAAHDAEALGKLISDSGFVCAIGIMGETQVMNKQDLLALLSQAAAPPEFQDVKVSVHWMVALASARIGLPGAPADQALALHSMMVREAGQWKLAALSLCQPGPAPSEDQVKAFVDRVAALPNSLRAGDTSELENAIHDDSFILAFVDPSLELRWANSKEQIVQMLQSVIAMVTIGDSRLDVSETVMNDSVAVVDGTWMLDITDFGQTESQIRALAVKVNGEWKIVALAGGPKQ